MKHPLPIVFVALVAGCGGNGDSAPVANTPAPSQDAGTSKAAQIDGTNYLDAFAIGTVAVSRVVDVAHIMGIVSYGASPLEPPGAQDCRAIGALQYHDMVYSEHESADRPCVSGSVELRSGIFEIGQGDLTAVSNVMWRRPPSPMVQEIGGQIGFNKSADGSATVVGWFFAVRDEGFADYAQVSVSVLPATGGNAAKASAGSLQVRAAPFAPHWLTTAASDSGTKVSVIAPDGTRVVVTEVAGGTTSARRFEVFDAGGPAPVVMQTLSMDDPLVTAAIARAQR